MKDSSIRMLSDIIEHSKRIVFFGGAGVSTASGIPDFRSAEGLYAAQAGNLSPEMILSKSFFYLQPELFFDFYREHMLFPEARPNAAHLFLYELEKKDKLRGIVGTFGYTSCMETFMRITAWSATPPGPWKKFFSQKESPAATAGE